MTDGNANPEVVRNYYDYVDAEAYEDLYTLFADDVVYVRPGQDAIEGKDEFRAFYESGRPLEGGRHDVHKVVVEGDTVTVRGTFTGTQGGETVSFGFADFHEFDEEGRIARRHTYTDRDTV